MTSELKALRLSSSSSPPPLSASEEGFGLVLVRTCPFLTINDNRRKVDEEKEANNVSYYKIEEERED